MLGLAQTACAPAQRNFDILPATEPIDLPERVYVGDLVYLELHNGESFRGEVQEVERFELVVDGWVFPVEEVRRLVIEYTAEDVKRAEKLLLTGTIFVVGTLIYLITMSSINKPDGES
jgi:small nuclear ribonucleoprotein (snRNP)-like protein